jgi:hypothetical protein
VNEATRKAIDLLRKAAKDSSSEGKVFRAPFEPTEGDNTRAGLAEAFDRNELEQAYLEQAAKDRVKDFDLMKNQVQNDLVAVIHRDTAFRYSSRIRRIAEETARRKAIARQATGLADSLETKIASFLALDAATPEAG